MAVITPRGIEISEATPVTVTDAMMSAKIPKSGGSDVGYHSLPRRKAFTETLLKIGSPSINRNRTMRDSVMMDAEAMRKKSIRIPRSFLRRFSAFRSPFVMLSISRLTLGSSLPRLWESRKTRASH
jgi:hypothetical protein